MCARACCARHVALGLLLPLFVRRRSLLFQVEQLIVQGGKLRMVASTKMNAESSRSHAIFQLKFTQTSVNSATANATDRVSKISLVDLAG